MSRLGIDQVESFAAARIAANATTAAFGAAKIYDPFEETEKSNADISARLKSVGVCIEINLVSATDSTQPNVRGEVADATFIVAVSESPTVAHSPNKTALCTAVIKAIEAEVDAYEPAAKFKELVGPFNHELGYVLTLLSFTKKVRTK